MAPTDARDGKKNLAASGEQQQSLLKIASDCYKKIGDTRTDERNEEVADFHNAVLRQRLLLDYKVEDEIVEIFEQGNKQFADLFLEPGSGGRNIFHTILERKRVSDKTALVLFLQHLVISYPEVLERKDDSGLTPLEQAAKNNKAIVFLIVDLVVPDETIVVLQRKCDKASKLSSAPSSEQKALVICEINLNKTLERRFRKPEEVDDSKCLHHLIDQNKLIDSNNNLQRILRGVLSPKDNKANENEANENEANENEANENEANENKVTCLHSLLDDDTPFTMENAEKSIETFRRLIVLCPSLIDIYNPDGFTPLHKAIQLYKSENFDFKLLNSVINELLERAPESIYSKVQGPSKLPDYNKSPYMLLRT
jgi:hypothetical protein